MKKEELQRLQGELVQKNRELEKKNEMLDRYVQNIGRDRWYNRARHDITTLRQEIKQIEASIQSVRFFGN